jgi:hypothetical protein
MRNVLKAIGIAVILALTPVIGGAADAPTPPPMQSGETEEGATALDDVWHSLDAMADAIKSTVKIARDGSGVLVEGTALMNTISVEAARVAELESKCLTEGEECTKAKQERCPVLGASYHRIEERFAAFDKKVAAATYPDDLKKFVALLSSNIKAGIKDLKEKLEDGKCIDA